MKSGTNSDPPNGLTTGPIGRRSGYFLIFGITKTWKSGVKANKSILMPGPGPAPVADQLREPQAPTGGSGLTPDRSFGGASR